MAVRRTRLRWRPLRANRGDLADGLGGDPVDALRGRVMRALPTVAAFERSLEGLEESERSTLLARADAVLAREFDLLGSGPCDLGPEIDWRLDFKSGRRWPLDHISRVAVVYPDDSDIKVPWELGRGQHLPLLGAAYRLTGERAYLDGLRSEIEGFIARNPVEFGPQWACTMDVAIRAANWTAALALVADRGDLRPWLDRVLAELLLHGRFIRSHLEWAERRGNHYLSNVVGLLPLAALFGAGGPGPDWARWAAAELVAEMEHQVRPDGCDHEASIPYHRLVCELFLAGAQAVDALTPGALTDEFRARLERMLGFVRDYTRPDGLAPQIGDADDGRFLPLGGYGSDPRSHLHLFEQAGASYRPARSCAAYPDGGWWILRSGELYAIVRCGDVGVGGLGPHAHNDQLAFELSRGDQPMVVDPGSYVYTADLEARGLFRSTAFHSTLEVGGQEQNPIEAAKPFEMRDHTRAQALLWEPDGRPVFEGRHHGYERLEPPATHTRRVELDGERLVIRDRVESEGGHRLRWTFPLAPCEARVESGAVVARFSRGLLRIESAGLELTLEQGWYSPRYGVRLPTPFVRVVRIARAGIDETVVVLHTEGA